MSPRRRIQPGQPPLLAPQPVAAPRDWPLMLRLSAAGLVIVAAITAGVLLLVSHESQRKTAVTEFTVLTDVRSFMTEFTSLDPYHANDYVDGVLSHATGEFAKQYEEKANEALFRVGKGEPTTGAILDAGVERWNDDGSVNVLVATEVTVKSSNGKDVGDMAYRWLVTATQEGDQWKISSLVQVI